MPGPLAESSSLFAGAEKVRSWIAGLSSANLGGKQSAGDIHSRGAGNRVCRESRRELAERKEAEEACELCGGVVSENQGYISSDWHMLA